MKKIFFRFIALMCVLVSGISFAGCGPVGDDNSGKTKIHINMYAGGHGETYIDTLIANFMADHPDYNEKYVITHKAEKHTPSGILDDLQAGYGETQMYITAFNNFVHFIYQDLLEDLSDVMLMKPDGEDGDTVKDKMVDYTGWQKLYSKYGQGIYTVPYADSIMGFVYDHEMFENNNWYTFATEAADGAALTAQGITYQVKNGKLIFKSSTDKVNYTDGDKILTKGKDGIYGTYDDGQPTNETEWDTMIRKISTSTKAFISGGSVGSYSQLIISSLFAQIGGVDEWNTYFNYDSKGQKVKLSDGSEEVITLENGYKVQKMDSLYKAYEWLAKYFDTRKEDSLVSIHPALTDGVKLHTDAQNLFLLGYQNVATNPRSAMLLDGAWWEYEARSMFTTLGGLDSNRGYGKREYRFMLLPDITGQKNEKSVMSCCETGAIFIPKDSDPDRLKVTKEFLAYMLSDEAMNFFLTETGSIMPYKYNLTSADYAKMTPFTRNMIELYNDTEHVDILRPQIATLQEPISYAGGRSVTYFIPQISSINIDAPFKAVRENSLETIKKGLGDYYNATDWARYIADAKTQGFYK